MMRRYYAVRYNDPDGNPVSLEYKSMDEAVKEAKVLFVRLNAATTEPVLVPVRVFQDEMSDDEVLTRRVTVWSKGLYTPAGHRLRGDVLRRSPHETHLNPLPIGGSQGSRTRPVTPVPGHLPTIRHLWNVRI